MNNDDDTTEATSSIKYISTDVVTDDNESKKMEADETNIRNRNNLSLYCYRIHYGQGRDTRRRKQ